MSHCSTMLTFRSKPANASGLSAATARASRRCSRSSPVSRRPTTVSSRARTNCRPSACRRSPSSISTRRCSTSLPRASAKRALLDEYDAVAHALADMPKGPQHDDLLARMNALQSALDTRDVWNWCTRVATTLAQIGLDGDARSSCSPTCWLDEPTNHLDFEGIRWLEELLVTLRMGLLFNHALSRVSGSRGDAHRRTGSRTVAVRIRAISAPIRRARRSNSKSNRSSKRSSTSCSFDKLLA